MPYRETRKKANWTEDDAEFMKENFPEQGSECFKKYREKGISYDQCRYFIITLGLLTSNKHG